MKMCPTCTGAGNIFVPKSNPNPLKCFQVCPECNGNGVIGLSPEQLAAFAKEKRLND